MYRHPLSLPLIIFILTVFSSVTWAQKIRVTKVKGNQAVVEFSGGRLQTGQAYELSSDDFAEPTSTARNYLVAVSASLENSKSDAANASSTTNLVLSGKFGWNSGTLEYGPQASYSSVGTSGITQTSLLIGFFGDYNLLPNRPGEVFLYGLGGFFDFGQLDSGVGTKSDLMGFFAGPFAKWFPTGSPVGFRIDLGYLYQKRSGVSSDTTTTGFSSNLALMAYF